MKKAEIIIMLLLATMTALAQGPQSFSYQAVVRNNAGEIVGNQDVSFRISIRNNSPTGTELYKETHSTSTNQFGVVTLQIGNGTPVSGLFSSINWGDNHSKYLKIEVDVSGGTSYISMGTSQLLSMPYSLNSKTTSGLTVMTSSERDAIASPEMGMALSNSDTRRINYHDGYGWLEITGVKQADFTCGNPLLDSRDGTYYNTVEIGGQCWMAENLNVGTMIPGTTNPSNNGIIEKYCFANQYCDTYGGLYQWNELMKYSNTEGAQGICPEGWHIPSDAEWTSLVNATGGVNNAGTNLVVGGGSGFEALMAGHRNPQLSGYPFAYIGDRAYFWTSTKTGSNPYDRYLKHNDSHVYTETPSFEYGFSIRCVEN